MNYLEYDAIVKKKCPECGVMDKLKGKNKALFGRSFPENSGVLMNKIKHMKAKYLNKEKPNYDPRDIALLYALNEGFKKGDYNTDEDGDYSAWGEKPSAPTHLTDFDVRTEIAALWRTIPNEVRNREGLTSYMMDWGVGPSYVSDSDTKNAFKTWKSRQKHHFSEIMKTRPPEEQYALHENVDSYFIEHFSGFPEEELDKDQVGLEAYGYGTNEPPEITEDI